MEQKDIQQPVFSNQSESTPVLNKIDSKTDEPLENEKKIFEKNEEVNQNFLEFSEKQNISPLENIDEINNEPKIPSDRKTNLSEFDKIVAILGAIGETDEDTQQLGDIHVSRGEVSYSICDKDSYYTADTINLLLCPLGKKDTNIKIYSAITPEQLENYSQQIKSQNQDYAFIPLNVAYDKDSLKRKNHWVALVINSQDQLIFYLDPAQKKNIFEQIELLKEYLDYKLPLTFNPIDFQQAEKEEGWVRHCGPYMVEMFKTFARYIQRNQYISGSSLPDINIDTNSVSVQTVLSEIPCGIAEDVTQIRRKHIDEIYEIFEAYSLNLETNKTTNKIQRIQNLDVKHINKPMPSDKNVEDDNSLPLYINGFFERYGNEKYMLFLQKIREEAFYKLQQKMKDEGLPHPPSTPPELGESFLIKFKNNDFFQKAGEFCKRAREVIKEFEINQLKKEPDTKSLVWRKRKNELLCLKYLCVSVAESPDERELKSFISKFIKNTVSVTLLSRNDSLIMGLNDLLDAYKENKIKVRMQMFPHDEAKTTAYIVKLECNLVRSENEKSQLKNEKDQMAVVAQTASDETSEVKKDATRRAISQAKIRRGFQLEFFSKQEEVEKQASTIKRLTNQHQRFIHRADELGIEIDTLKHDLAEAQRALEEANGGRPKCSIM